MHYNYHTIESRIGFMQAFPYRTYTNLLGNYVMAEDEDGIYVLEKYNPFLYLFDN